MTTQLFIIYIKEMIQLSKHFQRILNASKEIASLNGKWLFSKRNRPVIGPSVNLRDKNEFTPSYALYPYGAGLTFKLISKFSKEDSNSRSKTTTKQEDMKETAKGQQQKPIINNNVQTLKNESQLLKDEKQNTNSNPSKTTMKQVEKKITEKGDLQQKNISDENVRQALIGIYSLFKQKQSKNKKKKFYEIFWIQLFSLIGGICLILFTVYMKYTHIFQSAKNSFYKVLMTQKYGIGSFENNTFGAVLKDYSVYEKIQKIFTKAVQKEYSFQIELITGPSGVGKTTCIKDLILSQQKNDGKRKTVVYYVNLKAVGSSEKPQINFQALGDLDGALGELLKGQSKNTTQNSILVLDEINLICKKQFKVYLYYLRGLIEHKVKIIAFSSCSDASKYLNSVIGGFVKRHDLEPLKKQDVKKFLSLKLKNYGLGDKVLDSIACKFTAIRKLQNLLTQFTPLNPSGTPQLKEEAIKHFNPISDQVKDFQEKINQTYDQLSKNQTMYQNLAQIIMINLVICLLESSLKDQPAIEDEAIKRFSQDKSWQRIIRRDFLNKLYQENIIFNRYPKDQNGRLALMKWVSKQLENKELKKMPEYNVLKAKWQELRPLCEKLQPSAGLEFVNNESKA